MKRAYRTVEVVTGTGGFGVALDGKPLDTPKRRPLLLPTHGLAEAIAAEWAAQGDTVRPWTMPLMQIAATALDEVAHRRPQLIGEIAGYAETDLLCYRADGPAELAWRQAEFWQPLLDWAALRFDASLAVTQGIAPLPQPAVAVAALRAAVERLGDLELAALALAVSACGSVVLGLALIEGRLDAEAATRTSLLDELYQAELWGEEEAAAARRTAIGRDIAAAAEFVRLLQG
jgi:chaperone required for assembly of F1-ATPase